MNRAHQRIFAEFGQDVGLIEQNAQRIGDATLFDDKTAIHVGLAKCKLGVEESSALGIVGEEADGDRIARSVAAGKPFAVCHGHGHRAAANEFGERET